MALQQFRNVPLRTVVAPLVGATALIAVLGCQVVKSPVGVANAAAPATTRTVEFDASDYAFATPDTLPSGMTTIRLVNRGQEPHHAQLLRLNDGVTFDQFTSVLQQEGEGALRLVSGAGGPGAIGPSGESEVTLDLKPGVYALACFISGPDEVPHLMKGMLKPIQVTESSEVSAAPQAQGTFTMKDFTFEMPSTLPAGRATYQVINSGPQMHELNVLKLAPGMTAQDLINWHGEDGAPPPFEAVGGMNAFSVDGSGYMTLDLQPGTYLAICNVPDPASGVAHSELGMIRQFTVTD
ncbi:MAG TPA: hypothetical protein VGJ60_31475 [Chloroflexota bacterium]|jgi:uncharacterized cupredoxin-like copper-binding protein